MDDALFEELKASIQEAGRIRSGMQQPAREFQFYEPDVKAIRTKTGLSQSRFSQMIGVSTKTLQNWEQGKSDPRGTAKALLKLVMVNPHMAVLALADPDTHFQSLETP